VLSGDEKLGCHLAFFEIVCQRQNVQADFSFFEC